jgi:hypothetical protein
VHVVSRRVLEMSLSVGYVLSLKREVRLVMVNVWGGAGATHVRQGIDGIVNISHAHFVVISGILNIRGLQKHHEIRRYSPDDIIDP